MDCKGINTCWKTTHFMYQKTKLLSTHIQRLLAHEPISDGKALMN